MCMKNTVLTREDLISDVLKTGGPATRTDAVGTGVYIKIDGKTWTEMPQNEKDTANTKFTKQACFLGMGK